MFHKRNLVTMRNVSGLLVVFSTEDGEFIDTDLVPCECFLEVPFGHFYFFFVRNFRKQLEAVLLGA